MGLSDAVPSRFANVTPTSPAISRIVVGDAAVVPVALASTTRRVDIFNLSTGFLYWRRNDGTAVTTLNGAPLAAGEYHTFYYSAPVGTAVSTLQLISDTAAQDVVVVEYES